MLCYDFSLYLVGRNGATEDILGKGAIQAIFKLTVTTTQNHRVRSHVRTLAGLVNVSELISGGWGGNQFKIIHRIFPI